MPFNHNELAHSLAVRLAHVHYQDRITWQNVALDRVGAIGARPDVFSIRRTLDWRRCQPWTCEVKVSRADFFGDVRAEKWHKYRAFSCRVFFAFPEGLVEHYEVPTEAGIFEFNREGHWHQRRAGRFCKGWTLTEFDLMKLILGRWGTPGILG